MARLHAFALLVFCAFASYEIVASASADPGIIDQQPRVRAATPSAQRLIHESARLSPSVRLLMDRLSCSDVIVYVQLTGAPQVKTGTTTFVATTPHGRYLRIQISASLPGWSRVHVLGHELQHAIEIATEPTVTSETALRDLYLKIGHSSEGEDRFETMAARQIEAVIRAELLRAGKFERE
jgi:hypothetical protein